MPTTPRVAVIGSGVAGLTAAHVAAKSARVTLFEADDRLGGHADTHLVPEGERTLAIDTGFIVHNRHTYPTLLRLFDELGVATRESEMSLSVRDDETGLEYAGALGLGGLFPGGANLSNVAYLRLVAEIPRFHRRARALLADPPEDFRAGRHDAARLPARRPVLAVLRAALHGAPRRRGLVVRPGGRPGLPGPLPLRVPPPPPDAQGLRVADLAHGRRRLARVRRPGRGRPRRRPSRHQGHLGAGHRLRRRGHRRQRRGHHRGRRRDRHPPRTRACDAGRADAGAARRPGRDPLLRQHRPSAHRRVAAAPRRGRPGVVELPPPRRPTARVRRPASR